MSEIEQRVRLLNTAVITTKIPQQPVNSTKLNAIVKSEAFSLILKCVQEFAKVKNIPEETAAAEIIQTFRNLDKVWDEYIFQEGLNQLKKQLRSDN